MTLSVSRKEKNSLLEREQAEVVVVAMDLLIKNLRLTKTMTTIVTTAAITTIITIRTITNTQWAEVTKAATTIIRLEMTIMATITTITILEKETKSFKIKGIKATRASVISTDNSITFTTTMTGVEGSMALAAEEMTTVATREEELREVLAQVAGTKVMVLTITMVARVVEVDLEAVVR